MLKSGAKNIASKVNFKAIDNMEGEDPAAYHQLDGDGSNHTSNPIPNDSTTNHWSENGVKKIGGSPKAVKQNQGQQNV